MKSFGSFLCGTGLFIAGTVTGAAIAGCLALGYCWHELNGTNDANAHQRRASSDWMQREQKNMQREA